MKKMKCLVTGGAGFIGSHLCKELLERGFQVTVVDNLSTGKKENLRELTKNENFQFIRGSIFTKSLMNNLLSKTDIVYHLAAAVGVKYILAHQVDSILNNLKGMEIILELAEKYHKKVVFTSTSEVYGKHGCGPIKEDDDRVLGSTAIARWSYSNAKSTDEMLALAYAKEKKLSVIIVRLFNTVGPNQVGCYGMVLPRFIEQALRNEPITVYGSGKQTRSFTYVADVVRAIIELSLSKKSEGTIFNVGSNNNMISIENLAKKIIRITGSNSKIKYIPYDKAYGAGFEDMDGRIPDISRMRETINYSPEYGMDDIIINTVEYFRKNKGF